MATKPDASTPDDYERRYMGADEAILRERVHMAWWGHAIFALASALVAYQAVVHGHVGGAVICPLLWLLFMTLRTTVSRSQLHVQLGIFGPKIPIEQIAQAEVTRPGVVTGWGIRLGFDGALTYSVPSTTYGYVQVVYRRGRRLRTVRIMSINPAQLVRAIDVARTEAGRRTRIATNLDAPKLAEENEDVVLSDPQSRAHTSRRTTR